MSGSSELDKFRVEFDQLPIVFDLGEYSIRDISHLFENGKYEDIEDGLRAGFEYGHDQFNEALEDNGEPPRKPDDFLISRSIEPGEVVQRRKQYAELFAMEIENVWVHFENVELGKDVLPSFYFFLYHGELDYARNLFIVRYFPHNVIPNLIDGDNNYSRDYIVEHQNPFSNKLSSEYWDSQWRRRLSKLLVSYKKHEALRLLNKLIDDRLPLFAGSPEILEERRIAWLFKIDLLREWGRLSEALAWICLECELHPENVTAQALKELLKQDLDLTQRIDPPAEAKHSHLSIWDGIAGMRELKALFERDVILPLKLPDLYKRYKVPMPNGILLFGPPGCGKTLFARKSAENLGYHFIQIKPSDLASTYVHGTQQMINELFNNAKEKAPCFLFLDEIEALVPNRGDAGVHQHYRAEVNEFLTQLNECSKRQILVVGATNLIKDIDPAILRPGRMDKKIFVGPPDYESRMEAFKLFMKERPQGKIDWVRLAEYSDLYTYAELEHIVNEAARSALEQRKNITTEDLVTSLASNKNSLSSEQIESMRKWSENN